MAGRLQLLHQLRDDAQVLVRGREEPAAAPSRADLVAIGAAALSLRLVLVAWVLTTTGADLPALARTADGVQYLAYARAWLGDAQEFLANPYFARLFPGYPLLIAGLDAIGVPAWAAGLLPSWLATAVAAPLAAAWSRDRRVGWAMAALTPSYVLSSTLICTEVICVLCSLAGVILAQRQRPWSAGLCFGIGGLFRPMAVFALLGAAGGELREGRRRTPLVLFGVAGAVVAAGLLLVGARFGDPLLSYHRYATDPGAYSGELLTLPFVSLVRTPLAGGVAPWKIAFVALHVVVLVAACWAAVREVRRNGAPEAALVPALWLWSHALFLTTIGSTWGFHDFPRFLVTALPPLFWALRRHLPRHAISWLIAGLLSAVLAVEPITRRIPEAMNPPAAAAAAVHPSAGAGK